MTVQVFDRTVMQRALALELANEVRFARAAMKRAFRAGTVTAAEILASPPDYVRSMRVAKFLGSIPKVGPTRVRRMMLLACVSESKTVGGLSDRQRRELVNLIGAVR